MALVVHLVVALSSIVYASYLFFRPSQTGLRISGGLVAATLVTGTYLVVSTHANLLSACATGLLYLSGLAVVMTTAYYRLVAAKNTGRRN